MYVHCFKNIEELKDYVKVEIDRDIKESPVIKYDSYKSITNLDTDEIVQELFSEVKDGDNDVMVKKINERFHNEETEDNVLGAINESIVEFKERYENVMPYFIYIREINSSILQWTLICVLADKNEKDYYTFCGWSV